MGGVVVFRLLHIEPLQDVKGADAVLVEYVYVYTLLELAPLTLFAVVPL
jgi:hypothetical protein